MSIDIEQRRLSQVARQTLLLHRPAGIGKPTHDEDGQPIIDAGMAPRALQQLGVPTAWVYGTFGDSSRSDAEEVREWWTSHRKGIERVPLVLAGPGSDSLACACARSAIMRDMAFGWMNWREYCQDQTDAIDHSTARTEDRAEWVTDQHDERERRHHVYELLVISGLSLLPVKDFMVPTIMAMLEARRDLITIFTASIEERDLVRRLDEAISPRAPLVKWLQDEASWSPDGGE